MSTGAVASNELHLVLNASGDAAAVLRKMAGEIDKTQKGAAGSARQMNKMATSGKRAQKSWTEFAAKWGTITAGFYAASRAVGMVVDGLESGGRAIALNNRIESLAGGTLKVEAAMRGLLGTMNETDTQGLVILMDQIGMTSEQIEIATRYALGYAEAMGKELGPTLERVTQAFASGRATSFRALGIDAANAAEAIQKMDAAGRGLVGSMDATGVSIKQARATWDDFVSDVEVGAVTVAASIIDGFGARTSEREFAARMDANAAKIREVTGASEEVAKRLAGIDQAIATNAFSAGKALEKAAEAIGMRKKQFESEHELWTQRNEALQDERSHIMWLLDRKADIRGIWDGIADSATEAMRRFMQLGMVPLAKGEAIEGSAAFTGPVRPTQKPRGRRSGPSLAERRRAQEQAYLDAYDRQQSAISDEQRRFALPTGNTQSQQHSNAGFAGGGNAAYTGQDANAELKTAADERRAIMDGFAESSAGFMTANANMWQALGDATGSKQALKVMAGFSAASMAIMAIDAGVRAVRNYGLAFEAFGLGNFWSGTQHLMAAASFTAVAAGKAIQAGATIKGIAGGGGGASHSSASGFDARDYYSDREGGGDKHTTIVINAGTVVGPEDAGDWINRQLEDVGMRGGSIPPAYGRRAGSGSMGGM